MKKLLIFIIAILFALPSFAQETYVPSAPQSASEPTDGSAYKLFPTQNMWTFLKLDTRNGRVWRVQFTVKDEKYRFEDVVSDERLIDVLDEKNGRFTLYATQNTYNFVMLGQIDGRCWQVQWGSNPGIIRIY